MAKQDYMPITDQDKAALFIHVRTNLPGFFTRLSITAATAQVVTQSNDALAFDFLCTTQRAIIASGQEATNAKNRLRDGDPISPNTTVPLTFPPPPSIPTNPPGAPPPAPPAFGAVTPGVVTRFRNFVKWVRALPGYAQDIGEALRIIGDESTDADPATLKPTLPLTITGGHVRIGWKWDGLSGQVDALEIHVDRGTGFVLLTVDTRPTYIDTEPFPAAGGKWKYKGIFRKDDQRVGQWSDVSEISV